MVHPALESRPWSGGLIERWYNLTNEPHQEEKTALQIVVDEKKTKKEKKASKKKKNNAEEVMEEKTGICENPTLAVEEKEKVVLGGSIRIGEHDIKDVDMKWWRSQIGLVQQEPFLFNVNIYENVSYGLMGTQWADSDETAKCEMVREACKEAYADEFVSRLPRDMTP